jgi:hypothetical protein
MSFNIVIQSHDLEEIPLKGRAFTWSNMQDNPLLERLDWVFTSADWTSDFPNTLSYPLARLGSDHVPIHIQIGTNVPSTNIFRFKNYWMDFNGFNEIVNKCWDEAIYYQDPARTICAKLKSVRYGLKKWSKNISKLNNIISNFHFTMALLE